MENRPPAGAAAQPAANEASTRRKRRNGVDVALRYFLPKPDSSPSALELGLEVASEGEALIQSFKNGHPYASLGEEESDFRVPTSLSMRERSDAEV